MSARFAGRVGIVTGAGSGIGEEVARRFAAEGGSAVLVGRHADTLDRVAADIVRAGGRALALVGDVTSASDIEAVVQRTIAEYGQIDVLVNNAGMSPRPVKTVLEITEEDFRRVIDVNLWGTFVCVRAAAPFMVQRGYGRIVNVGSRAHLGEPRLSIYSASKAALHGFTKSIAMELGPHGITVNVTAPGSTPTGMMRSHPDYEQRVQRMLEAIPLQRMGETADQAAAILFLASEEAGFITSEILHVSGGRYTSNNQMGLDA